MKIGAAILAGEREGPRTVADAEGVPLKVLVDVAGEPMLQRVLATVGRQDDLVCTLLCGPEASELDRIEWLKSRVDTGELRWVEPQGSPSRSAFRALEVAREQALEAVVLTTGDHPLLRSETLAAFMQAAQASGAGVAVGLARHSEVQRAFPDTKRTALKFADGWRCGCNLFWLRTDAAGALLSFWQRVEQDRKRPHRVARALGVGTIARYLAGRLDSGYAMRRLSKITGVQVAIVDVDDPDAAVDVDSLQDLALVRSRVAQRESGVSK